MNAFVKHYVFLTTLYLLFSTNKIIAGYADVWVNPVQNVIAVRTYFPAGPTWTDQTCLALYAVQGAQSFVTSAWYGDPAAGKSVGSGRYDVTKILNNTISQQRGGLNLRGSSFNSRFGDPAFGVTKTLSILFTSGLAIAPTEATSLSTTTTDQIGSLNYMKLPGDSLNLITVIPGNFNTAAWSSDGQYLAIGGGEDMRMGPDCGFFNKDKLRIYKFIGTSLVPMASCSYPAFPLGRIKSVSWQPGSTSPYNLAVIGMIDGIMPRRYFDSVGFSINLPSLVIYQFNVPTNSLTQTYATPSMTFPNYGPNYTMVGWSPNGEYIAAADFLREQDGVNPPTGYLTVFDTALNVLSRSSTFPNLSSTTIDTNSPITGLAWSSASDRVGVSMVTFLSASVGDPTTAQQTLIYTWNGSTQSLSSSPNRTIGSGASGSWNGALAWNHDDTQLALYTGYGNNTDGIFPSTNYNPIRVYNYTKGTPDTLTPNVSASINPTTDGTTAQQFWSQQPYWIYFSVSYALLYNVGTIGWGPADRFLAVGTYGALANIGSGFGTFANADMRAYEWQFTNLSPVKSYGYGTEGQGTIKAMAWSPDGLYLAVAGTNGAVSGGFTTAYQVRIYALGTGQTLVPVTGFNYGTSVNALAWSSSHGYLTVGGSGPGNDGIGGFNNAHSLRMYSFNGTMVSAYSSVASTGTINAMEWANSQYLAVGGDGGTLAIYNIVASALNQLATASFSSRTVYALSWSSWQTSSFTGAYLAVAATRTGSTGTAAGCLIYKFTVPSTFAYVTYFDDTSVTGYSTNYTQFKNVLWDKAVTSSPFKIAGGALGQGASSDGVGLYYVLTFNTTGPTLTKVNDGTGCSSIRSLGVPVNPMLAWVNVAGGKYLIANVVMPELVANVRLPAYDTMFFYYNGTYLGTGTYALTYVYPLFYSLSYGTGLAAIAVNPVFTNLFAMGGTAPTNDVIGAGFAGTNELRLYSVPTTAFLSLASQTYGNTINTNDVLRPESGMSASVPNATTLSSGEGITGVVDIANGLSLLATAAPLPTIATTQSLHNGDLDLTQGCIQLDGALRLGPGSNILTSTQAAPRGSIYLNNQTLFLQGDTTLSTTITNFQTAVQLLSPGIIDGLEYNLAINGPVMLRTAGSTPINRHLFRNITFSNLWDFHANGDWYPFYDDGGNGVIFENVTFLTQPGQAVTLATPSITIEGTCTIVGGGTFSLSPYGGAINPVINIAGEATLYVGQGTTLRAHVINFADQTSMLSLDGATLLNTCATGPLHLTKGTLNYNGLVTLSSLYNSSFAIGNGISEAQDLHIVGQAAATLKFDQSSTCTGKSTCWYRNVH